MVGAVVAALAIFAWWVFFSRAPWSERLGGLGLMIAALFATSRVVHASIAGGAMGALLYVWAIPFSSVALVAWAALSRGLSGAARRASMVATILLACGVWTLDTDRWRHQQPDRLGVPLAVDADRRATAAARTRAPSHGACSGPGCTAHFRESGSRPGERR